MRLKWINTGVAFSLVCCLSIGVVAQPKPVAGKILTLRDAVLLAIRSNSAARSAYLQRVLDKFSVRVAYNVFEPHVSLTGRAHFLPNDKPDYHVNPGLSLLSPIGTQWNVALDRPLHGNGQRTLTASVSQPLLRGFGWGVVTSGLQNALDQEHAQKLALKASVMEVINQTVFSYRQWVQDARTLAVRKLALKAAEQQLKEFRIKVHTGSVPASGLVEQESQKVSQEIAVSEASAAIDRDRHALLVLLGLDPKRALRIDPNITVGKITIPDLQESVRIALRDNVAYQQERLALRRLERGLLVAKNQQRWGLNLVGNLSSTHGGDVPHITNKEWGLSLDMPVHDLPRQQQWVQAKIALQQARIRFALSKDRVVTQVTDFINAIKGDRQRIRWADKVAALNKRTDYIARLRYAHGYISEFQLIAQHNALINATLDEINRTIGYLNTLARFQQFLGQTLRVWHVTVQY